jgi:hypothetical protein
MSNVQYVDNEKLTSNQSEYRTERIFQNEKLVKNQVYYYSFGEIKEILNKNIIMKQGNSKINI